ncbi:MAG: hypothetical protein ACI9J2_000609 [Saprospiraceae bacterium]|jgi:hypothetical protein
MIDKAKHNTLKSVGIAGAAVTTAILSTTALAEMIKPVDAGRDISLLVGKGTHSGTVNVMIQNRGKIQKNISRMSPSHITTELGDVDLDKLFEEGPVLLGANQELVFSVAPANSNRTLYNYKPVQIHTSSDKLTAKSPMHHPQVVWEIA